jgi:hypothetical protein
MMNVICLTDAQVAYVLQTLEHEHDALGNLAIGPAVLEAQELNASCRGAIALPENRYNHLTEEQRVFIVDIFIELALGDCHQDDDYTIGVLQRLSELITLSEMLKWISGEHEMQCELLGFDPETGKEDDQ